MNNNRDLRFAFFAGLVTAFLLLPILLNLGKLNVYTAAAALAYPFAALIGMWVAKKIFANVLWILQFAKFALTGAMNTVLDAGILNLLSYLTGIYAGGWIVALNSISFIVAVTNSYFWNKHWTFARADGAKAVEYLEFIGVAFVGLLLSNGIVYAVTTYIPTDGLTPAMVENIAKIIATAIVMFWNFTGFKFFVFKA
ncbi:MAG: GtrA family protein [Candidatus Niyogibacteria bacterium]|nr:GtrA family protein [Candidatus Niyogibacteria bacterium]